MKNKIALLTVMLLFYSKGGIAFENNPGTGTESSNSRIIHTPVTSLRANETLVIEARIDGAGPDVAFMRLYFKTARSESFDFVEMTGGVTGFWGELTPDKFAGANIEYFLLALLADQHAITFPEKNPYGNPIRVNVTAAAPGAKTPIITPQVTPPQTPAIAKPDSQLPKRSEVKPEINKTGEDSPVIILSPEGGEVFGVEDEVLIAASFVSPEKDPINVKSLNIFIGNLNVTKSADVSENLLTYTAKGLRPGNYRVVIHGRYQSGIQIPNTVINFTVKGEKKRSDEESPIQGRVFAETRQENISNVNFSDNNIGGYVAGKAGFLKYDAKVMLTTREDEQFQPRNRYSLNLEMPVLGLTIGDTYPRFNDLMLWGKRVRGFHGRMHLGFFNVDVITGETVRKVKSTTSFVLNPATGDTLQTIAGVDSTRLNFGTFSQNLLGVRSSFGGGRNFQLGFNFLKVRDDTTSLKAGQFITFPQDNLVIGSDLLIAFANHRVEFNAAAAFSWLTNDISTGPLDKKEIEDQFDVKLPVDPADFSDLLIINSSTTPLDPRDLNSLAYNMSFRFNLLNNNLQLGYKSIGGEYNSLGNAYLRNNIQGFYIDDRIRLFGNKLYLNFGLEQFKDNFKADDENPSTNLNTISSGFSIYPGRSFPSITFSLRNHIRDNEIDTLFIDLSNVVPDTIDNRENNNTQDWSVMLNYDTRFLNLDHSISMSYITSNRNDEFIPTTENSSNVQVVTVRTRYQFPLVTTINFARNDNDFADGLNTFKFNMFGAKAEYQFWGRRLLTYLGINYTAASGKSAINAATPSAVTDYQRTAFNTGSRFEITPGHYFLLDASLISFSDNGKTLDTTTGTLIGNPSFTDKIFRLFYEKRF